MKPIKTSEQLPPKMKKILFHIKHSIWQEGEYLGCMQDYDKIHIYHHWDGYCMSKSEFVDYWMPLPEISDETD